MSSTVQRDLFKPTSDIPLIFVTPAEESKIKKVVKFVIEKPFFRTEIHSDFFINEHKGVLLAKGGKLWVVSPVSENKS